VLDEMSNNMQEDTNNKLVCDKCGSELRGEVCEKCYTEEDQGFSSYTLGQNITRYIILFAASGLLSLAYIGASDEFGSKSRIIASGTRFFIFIAIYSLNMTVIFVLEAMGILTQEQATKQDPLSMIRLSFTRRK
jgi:ribosomal protein L40E